jgi:hypothetical protein
MTTVHGELDIDVDDYLDSASTDSLICELESRGYVVDKEEDNSTPTFDTCMGLKKYVLELFGLKPYDSKERLIQEINEIF